MATTEVEQSIEQRIKNLVPEFKGLGDKVYSKELEKHAKKLEAIAKNPKTSAEDRRTCIDGIAHFSTSSNFWPTFEGDQSLWKMFTVVYAQAGNKLQEASESDWQQACLDSARGLTFAANQGDERYKSMATGYLDSIGREYEAAPEVRLECAKSIYDLAKQDQTRYAGDLQDRAIQRVGGILDNFILRTGREPLPESEFLGSTIGYLQDLYAITKQQMRGLLYFSELYKKNPDPALRENLRKHGETLATELLDPKAVMEKYKKAMGELKTLIKIADNWGGLSGHTLGKLKDIFQPSAASEPPHDHVSHFEKSLVKIDMSGLLPAERSLLSEYHALLNDPRAGKVDSAPANE